jgi:hypothetical protein
MALYCGIDLHSDNHLVVVIDEQDRRRVEQRLPNDLQEELAGCPKELLAAVVAPGRAGPAWPG